MGQTMLRNWDWENCVWANLPSPIWQGWVSIRRVIPPIQGLRNPIRQVVPRITHIHSYPPFCAHLHPPSLFLFHNSTIITEQKVKLSLSIAPCHDYELTMSAGYTEYSIDWVQHTPSTAYTEHCIYWVQHTKSKVYTEYSIHQRLSVSPSFSWLQVDHWM